MSLLNLNQSKLITLKEKAEKILKELQMNCDLDYENYHEALDQLTAIDGWTEGQSTDGGYAEGHDRYARQEEYIKELKAQLDKQQTRISFFELIIAQINLEELRLICDFDFENYYDSRCQLTVIDRWGDEEGDMRYGRAKKYFQAMKAQLDRSTVILQEQEYLHIKEQEQALYCEYEKFSD